MRIAEVAFSYPSGESVVRRIDMIPSRASVVSSSRRTPLSLSRNSGFDHVRHSGESM